MGELRLKRWDVVDHLKTDEELVLYLEAVLEDGMPELIAAALVDIARAKGLFATSSPIPRGESYLEKAIEDSYRRNLDGLPKWVTYPARVIEGAG